MLGVGGCYRDIRSSHPLLSPSALLLLLAPNDLKNFTDKFFFFPFFFLTFVRARVVYINYMRVYVYIYTLSNVFRRYINR